jgi:hypothetical protein
MIVMFTARRLKPGAGTSFGARGTRPAPCRRAFSAPTTPGTSGTRTS